jgi:hypothetical protein
MMKFTGENWQLFGPIIDGHASRDAGALFLEVLSSSWRGASATKRSSPSGLLRGACHRAALFR